jgi:RNA polymerase sigma-70 factor (ECF subfamily)
MVVTAGASAEESADSLAQLCEAYWHPLYAYVRRSGHGVEDARDLTQEFFARILEKKSLREADHERGRFRSFLLASLKHFLANEWDRARAEKRGGGAVSISLDAATAEERYKLEPADRLTPEKIFEREWALTLLDRTIANLGEQYSYEGKQELFGRIKDFLAGDVARGGYDAAAAELGMTEGALKVAVSRARRRFGDLLRLEVAATVADAADTQDEVGHLLTALAV